MTERTQLEAAIDQQDALATANLGTPEGQAAKQMGHWLRQLHAWKFPLEDEEDEEDVVVDLDEHRLRDEREFETNTMLYVEATWGAETVGFNVACRDLEGIRHGTEAPGRELRPPETTHEATYSVLHLRALANKLAMFFDLEHLVREEDDKAVGQ